MLHIHCTAKLATAARLNLLPAPDQGSLPWLDRWYANIAPWDRQSNVIIFTNAESLFTILVPQPARKVTFFAVVAEFRQKVRSALVDAGMGPDRIAAIDLRHAQYATCKTASKSVLGSMNEMAFIIETILWPRQLDGESITVEDMQDRLNDVPHSPLRYGFPGRRFRELILAG